MSHAAVRTRSALRVRREPTRWIGRLRAGRRSSPGPASAALLGGGRSRVVAAPTTTRLRDLELRSVQQAFVLVARDRRRQGRATRRSPRPIYKQSFDLRDRRVPRRPGACALPVYPVRVRDGRVEVGDRPHVSTPRARSESLRRDVARSRRRRHRAARLRCSSRLLARAADADRGRALRAAPRDAGRAAQAQYYRELIPAEPPGPGQQYAFEVDLDTCTGCKACVPRATA